MRKLTGIYWAAAVFSMSVGGCGGAKEPPPATPATAAAKIIPQAERVIGVGRVEPEVKIYKLSAEVSGVAQKVLAQNGDFVKAGQTIIELARETETNQAVQAEVTLRAREADIRTLSASIETEKVRLQNAETKLTRTRNLVARQAETAQRLDDDETDAKARRKEIERLEASLAAGRVAIEDARVKLEGARLQLDKRILRAPAAGRILTMDVTPGASVTAMTPYAEFAPESPLSVLTEIDELFADQVRVGARADIRAQGTDVVLARGEVIYAAPYLKKKSLFSETTNDMEDRRVREVRIRVTEGVDKLLIGARMECIVFMK